jgi:molecular chaperone IbpA
MSIGKNLDFMLGFSNDVRNTLDVNGTCGFPKTNIFVTAEDKTILEFALAGYSKNDLNVETHNGALIVSGSMPKSSVDSFFKKQVVQQGISQREFKRSYLLQRYAVVESVKFVDGILRIVIREDIPEEKKPKSIPIN